MQREQLSCVLAGCANDRVFRMSTYALSFRIGNVTVAGLSHDARRAKLIEKAGAENMGFWEEIPSFLFVESDMTTDVLAKRVIEGLSPEHDMLVIFDPADMSAYYFGAVEHEDVLRSFLPGARKLG